MANKELNDEIAALNAKLTTKLLRHISGRLASRDDCRKTEYIVHIDLRGETNIIYMDQDIYVYPSLQMRTEEFRRTIIEHVLKTYMHPNIYQGQLNDESKYVTIPVFQIGTYKYQLSVDGKRRKWTRIA